MIKNLITGIGGFDKEQERRRKISQTMKGKKPKNFEKMQKKGIDLQKKNHGNSGIFKDGIKHPNWKGDKAGYMALHGWVRKNLLISKVCKFCNGDYNIELSNISGQYKRELGDWQWLCAKCHRAYDKGRNSIKEKYG